MMVCSKIFSLFSCSISDSVECTDDILHRRSVTQFDKLSAQLLIARIFHTMEITAEKRTTESSLNGRQNCHELILVLIFVLGISTEM